VKSWQRRIHWTSLLLIPALFLSIHSCASLREWINERDSFSRTYSLDFMSFHPRLNSALQDYARKQKGSSFQVIRLGNDAVVIQGLYRGEQAQDGFPSTITVNPVGPGKTRVKIKILAKGSTISSEDQKEAARDLFQIIEKETGLRPEE
jgi:hypothetical protein